MRILHVTESRGWSGGTVQLWRLCEHLRRAGHAVALFCPPEGELLKHTPGSGVETFLSPMRQDYDLPAARRIADAVRRFRPDIVHAHHPRAHALTLIASYFAPVPCLVVSRRVSFRLKKWNLFSQLKYRTPRVRAYVAVSSDIRNVLIAGGVPAERVRVIYSGVDVDAFAPRPPNEPLRRALGLPADKPLVASLTHFSWWKGQTYFLEAAKKILDNGTPAHFLLVGKDTDGAEARAKVSSLGIEKNVTLAGFRTDVAEVLSLAAASVVSSLAGEGFSGVLRESMSMGVPVVATDVGGNKELVRNEATGLLVPPGDAGAMAAALGRLLADKTLAGTLARAGQTLVRDNFSLGSTVRNTTDFSEDLLRA